MRKTVAPSAIKASAIAKIVRTIPVNFLIEKRSRKSKNAFISFAKSMLPISHRSIYPSRELDFKFQQEAEMIG